MPRKTDRARPSTRWSRQPLAFWSAKASTNRIAELAGVSVGSLYQYFPSKEALVAAVIDRHNQEIMAIVRAALAEAIALPIEKAVRKLVAVAVEAHRIDPKLHRVLAEQIPRTGQLRDVEAFNARFSHSSAPTSRAAARSCATSIRS
ncbi:TetR/AcrR family transcriptional regulator [Bradyrhizobium neotropicale]|uniref:TetR/AcrR family transcriptional regulator n=1 Tax=Bradyrhizobium neotropicale TaxID=1497615 RepID=UPI000AB88AFB|nr:TetR/AcrR family transcriptional regulator [Bradyrhizobium neotropicale]